MNRDIRTAQPRQDVRRAALDELVERRHLRSVQAIERGLRHLAGAIRARRRRPQERRS